METHNRGYPVAKANPARLKCQRLMDKASCIVVRRQPEHKEYIRDLARQRKVKLRTLPAAWSSNIPLHRAIRTRQLCCQINSVDHGRCKVR